MNKLKVLIIGGTGCISSALVNECISTGIAVTTINRGRRKDQNSDKVTLIKADKNDLNRIKSALAEETFDAVIDFLCYTKEDLKTSFNFYSNYADQYFFISSCAVYDLRSVKIGLEDGPKSDERWNYSVNKWDAEELLRKLAKEQNKSYTIVRPSVTYGDTRIPYGITPPYGKHGTLIQRILHGKPIIRWNGGENVCNMMRVEDFSRAFVKLIANKDAYNTEFNICSEKYYSYNQVIQIIERHYDKKATIIDISVDEYAQLLPERKGELIVDRGADRISSLKKFKQLFPDFQEKYDLEKGLNKTLSAYEAQNWMNGISWEFDGECDGIKKKLIKAKRIRSPKLNTQFIDYLSNSSKKDRVLYLMGVYKNTIPVRAIKYFKPILKDIYLKIHG